MVFSTSTPLSRTKVASWYISLPTLYWYRVLVVSKSVYTVLEVSSARLDTFLSLSPLNIPTMVVLTVAVECDSLSASYGLALSVRVSPTLSPLVLARSSWTIDICLSDAFR